MSAADREALLAERIGERIEDARGAYLARAVLTGVVPTEAEVERELARALARPDAAIARIRTERVARANGPVRLVDGIVVDATDTAQSRFTSGIQRVAREVVAAWSAAGVPMTLGAWDRSGAFRAATPAEAERAGAPGAGSRERVLLVPDRATLVLPEIATQRGRAQRLAAIARHGAARSLAIGFDCIPVTTAESAPEGMPAAFSRYLAGVARFDRVAAISQAAATEYAGWASMLPAAGLRAPEVTAVPLPITPIRAEPEAEASIRAGLGLGPDPIVLVVGSHEPRKNHLTILAAAELAWRAGRRFELVFAGGRSWDSEEFEAFAARLAADGRPVRLVTGSSDARLAGLYRSAALSVFASFNEGFGLPIAESLAAGTPVVTAGFGSQREAARTPGSAFVDPRDPRAIAEAIADGLAGRIAPPEAGVADGRGWPEYAAEVLALLR